MHVLSMLRAAMLQLSKYTVPKGATLLLAGRSLMVLLVGVRDIRGTGLPTKPITSTTSPQPGAKCSFLQARFAAGGGEPNSAEPPWCQRLGSSASRRAQAGARNTHPRPT